jgi:integrase
MRPGELDALRWTKIDFQAGTILVDEQWNAKVAAFTPPKHGVVGTIALTDPARERLLALPRESEFAFTTLRGSHYRPSSRSYHWNRVRCAAGFASVDLHTATRHYFGWYDGSLTLTMCRVGATRRVPVPQSGRRSRAGLPR